MRLTDKQILIIKTTLAIMFAVNAGENIGYVAATLSVVPFIFPFFVRSFFYLVCVLIVQWILFSDRLPKWWFINGFIGCLISAFLIEILLPLSSFSPPSIQYYIVDMLRYLLVGLIAVVPQSIFLGKQGYLWLLLNALGWAFNQIYISLLIYPIFSTVPFYIVILITATNGLPLGFMLSLYLHKVLKGQYVQNTE